MIKVTQEGAKWFHSPTEHELNALKVRMRKSIMDWITTYIRTRVKDNHLQESRMPIAGYSTNPVLIPWKGTLKPHRRPKGGQVRRGVGMFFPGGYLQYRQNLGLSEAFSWYNTGDGWRDWKTLLYGDESTPGQIGFSKEENGIASTEAQKLRPQLFSIDANELSVVHTKVIEQINSTFFPASNG